MKKILFILTILVSSIGFSQDSISNFLEFSFANSNVKGSRENGSVISLGRRINKYSINVSYSNYKSLQSLEVNNQYNFVQKPNFSFGPSIGIGYAESSLNIDQNSFFYSHNNIDIKKSAIISTAVNFYLYGMFNISIKHRSGFDNLKGNGLVYSIGMKFDIK